MQPSSSEPVGARPVEPPLHNQAVRRERLLNLAERVGDVQPSAWSLPLGATVTEQGVHYRVWCPQKSLTLHIQSDDEGQRQLKTELLEDGYQEVLDPLGLAGDRYLYCHEDQGQWPDPASRYQPEGVLGPSLVVDPAYAWKDQEWKRPPFRDLVIYELHIGTFTREGTFQSAIQQLPALKELGITALEIMPLADFWGKRNWGYDGVCLYAPANAYGTPDDLRALIEAAHQHGLAVLLDVVYNHIGPAGSSLAAFSPFYFDPSKPTPWGPTFNFDGPDSKPVRDYFLWNVQYWMEEFHVDGFRFDATHAIHDTSYPHLLTELAAKVHARGGYVIAEDDRNNARLIEPADKGGYGFDAVWADDFHHSVRVSQTRERHSYLQNFSGTLEETVETLKHGWLFRGQLRVPGSTMTRGTEVAHVQPSALIHCISNHDQSGNRAFGERLHSSIPEASYRAISMLLCLSPYTPMLFMGQEWAASTPFLYFTDHQPELGVLVTEGRRREFAGFPEFNDAALLTQIPDPQQEETFQRAKLRWDERPLALHAGVLNLYQTCLQLRNAQAAFRPVSRERWDVMVIGRGIACMRLEDWSSTYLLVFHLWPEDELAELSFSQLPWGREVTQWQLVFSSNDPSFGGQGCTLQPSEGRYLFGQAEVLLLHASSSQSSAAALQNDLQ